MSQKCITCGGELDRLKMKKKLKRQNQWLFRVASHRRRFLDDQVALRASYVRASRREGATSDVSDMSTNQRAGRGLKRDGEKGGQG